jgi:nucleoside-diphosphate-sugar epimerase
MKIFVTGASGWIGSAVVTELLDAGHQVVGLGRSDAAASSLQTAGVEVVRGDLDTLDVLRDTAAASDGVIHLAFKHDLAFSGNFQAAADADRQVVEVFAEALAGSNKPFVIASGVLGLSPGKVATEQDGHYSSSEPLAQLSGPEVRHATAEFVLSLASQDIRSSIVRLAPTNHGQGDNGFMATIVGIAKAKGVSAYIGDGTNRWPAIHRLDSARLFRLAVEKAPAGSTLHGVAEAGIPIRDIAEAIATQLNIPVASLSPEAAAEHFTWLATFLALDSPASNDLTRERMDWQPSHPGLITDIQQAAYTQTS